MRVFSFGGGVQSTAVLVLAAQGKVDYQTFLFCNVGADSENPATIEYVNDYAKPFAAEYGLELIELNRVRRPGFPTTLLGHLEQSKRSIGIPVRVGPGKPGDRQCTQDFKIRVVGRWLKKRGATPTSPAIVGLGISMDEFQRARTPFDPRQPYQLREYPLLDLKLYRDQCLEIVRKAGLPPPPKSSCWFCPLHTMGAWKEQARKEPVLFAKSCDLEDMLNRRRTALGKDAVWFSTRLRPLREVVEDDGQMDLIDDGCETGYCMT